MLIQCEHLSRSSLQSLGCTEVCLVCGSSATVLADELGVSYQVFVVREILLDVPRVLQETEMLFMPWVGHLNLGHSYHLLPVMRICSLYKDSRMAVRCSREIPICT